jgi:hypothetical protein
MLAKYFRNIRATALTGFSLDRTAQAYHPRKCFKAQALARYPQRSRRLSFRAQARAVRNRFFLRAVNVSRFLAGRFSLE